MFIVLAPSCKKRHVVSWPWAEDMLCCWLLSTGLIERRLHMVRSYKFSRSSFFSISWFFLFFFLFFSPIYKRGTMGWLSLLWLLMNPILPPHGKRLIRRRKNTFCHSLFWWRALSVYMWCVCACMCVKCCVIAVMGWTEWPGGLFQRLPKAHPPLCSLFSPPLFSSLPLLFIFFHSTLNILLFHIEPTIH